MQYHLTFDRQPTSGPQFLLIGLEYDPLTRRLGLKSMPGDAIVIGPIYPPAAPPPELAAIAADAGGQIYVVACTSQHVLRVTIGHSGAVESVDSWPPRPGGEAAPEFRPTAILPGQLDLIWFADPKSNRVQLFDRASGTPRGEAGGNFLKPTFLTSDSQGRVFVSDAHGVTRFAAAGRADPMGTPIQLSAGQQPGAVAVLPDVGDRHGETLVLADGATLRRFTLEGNPVPWTNDNLFARPSAASSSRCP